MTLTAENRCDRCGAQAYVRVAMHAGDLMFCAHHARQHGDKIVEVALDMEDHRHQLA